MYNLSIFVRQCNRSARSVRLDPVNEVALRKKDFPTKNGNIIHS